MARLLRRGGEGVRAGPPRKKNFFLKLEKNEATKLEGGGGKALVAGPLKKITFLRLPLARLPGFRASFYTLMD